MNRVSERALDYPGHDARYYYAGNPFSGVGVSHYPSGELKAETEYGDGVPWGQFRRYRKDGKLSVEGAHLASHREGFWRTWHPNGQLATEEWYHFGCALTRKRWDSEAHLLEDFSLAETDPQYQQLVQMREIFGIDDQPIPMPPKNPDGR